MSDEKEKNGGKQPVGEIKSDPEAKEAAQPQEVPQLEAEPQVSRCRKRQRQLRLQRSRKRAAVKRSCRSCAGAPSAAKLSCREAHAAELRAMARDRRRAAGRTCA